MPTRMAPPMTNASEGAHMPAGSKKPVTLEGSVISDINPPASEDPGVKLDPSMVMVEFLSMTVELNGSG